MARRPWWHARNPMWRWVLQVAAWCGIVLAIFTLIASSILVIVRIMS